MTSNILYHINELKDAWRQQDFTFTKEQQAQYDILMDARRECVKQYYKEGRVFKGSSKQDAN